MFNSKIIVSSTGGKVNVKADGKVASVTVNKKTTLKVSGSTPNAVKITSNATGASINVASKANVQLNKSSVVNVQKGGQVGVVNAKANANVNVAESAKVTNVNTYGENAKINVKADGTVVKLNVNKKANVNVKGDTDTVVKVTSKAEDATFVIDAKSDLVLTEKANVTVTEGTVIGTLVANKDADIKVAEGATVEKVEVKGTDAKVNLEANGTVGTVSVDAKADVAVTGSTTSTVKVEANVEGASVTTAVKTEVKANANVDVTVEKGAEGSKVTAGSEDVKTNVSNKSEQPVTITDSKGTETKVDAGESTKLETSEAPETPAPVIPSGPSTPSQPQIKEYDVYVGYGPNSGNTFTVDMDALGLTKDSFTLKKGDKDIIITEFRKSEGGYAITIDKFDEGEYTLTIKGDGTKYKDTIITFYRDTTPPTLSISGTLNENVYVSDAEKWTPKTVTATDNRDTAVTVYQNYCVYTGDAEESKLNTKKDVIEHLETIGNRVLVRYTAYDNAGNEATADVIYTSVADETVTGVSIQGTAAVGNTLTANVTGGGGLTYQWQSSSDGSTYNNIANATNKDYVLTSSDYNKYIKVVVKQGSTEITSDATAQVAKGTLTVATAPTVVGTVVIGTQLEKVTITSGTVKNVNGDTVEGTFAWTTPSTTTTGAGSYGYTFTPTSDVDKNAYNELTGTISITEQLAKPVFYDNDAPKIRISERTYENATAVTTYYIWIRLNGTDPNAQKYRISVKKDGKEVATNAVDIGSIICTGKYEDAIELKLAEGVEGLSVNETYQVTVTAIPAEGSKYIASEESVPVTADIKQLLSAPTVDTVALVKEGENWKVKFTIKPVDKAKGYIVVVSDGNLNECVTTQSAGEVTINLKTELTVGKTYSVYVRSDLGGEA